MSILKFPNPAAFTQSIRMRRNGAEPGTLFLIVEGVSDKRTFLPLLDNGIHYVPARGKPMVVEAFNTLSSEGVDDCMFVVDCDGEDNRDILGVPNLVVSVNRDVDADLLLSLSSFERVALEYLSEHADTGTDTQALASSLLDYSRELTALFGLHLDAARMEGKPVKLVDPVTSLRRRIRPTDVQAFDLWVRNFVIPDANELVNAIGAALSWGDGDQAGVLERGLRGAEKHCRLHGGSRCAFCTPRTYSSGHDLVDVLALGLSQRCGFVVSPAEFARVVRVAAQAGVRDSWAVGQRIKMWRDERASA